MIGIETENNIAENNSLTVEERFCDFLSIDKSSNEFYKFNWLGLFSDRKCEIINASPAQILQKITEEKLSLDDNDKDMVVMQHQFEYLYENKKQKLNHNNYETENSLFTNNEELTNTISLKNNNEEFIKIGRTMNDMKTRFLGKREMPYEYEVLKIVEGDPGFIYDKENSSSY